MLNPRSGWFRDLCCFLAYALVVMLWLDTGYSQQIPASPAGSAHSSAAVPQSDYPPNARLAAKTNPRAKPLPRAPLVQTPDFRSVISVGRTLSSVTVSGVVNNTLTITYAVYNLRGDPVNGVLLTTTLLPGVTFQSATPLPDRSGQQLAFSLGSLPPLGSATAQLTVTLAGPGTTQIDSGAQAFGYWNGLAVQSTALPAALRTGSIDPTLLGSGSSIDANPTDPFVAGQAAQLGNDPQRIFQFVRDQIGYESYQGALRGARGALWSMAGDSLDKANLLVALLRASGIPARYVSGTLSVTQQKQLILSMFPPQIQLTGYIATGAQLSDPANDPKLQAEAAPHYWVQFDSGAGFMDADPDFAGAQIGQTFTAAQGTFSEVADSLHHHVTVRLNTETYQSGFFGAITSTATPLSQTFTSAELVGHPLTVGHLVQTQTAGSVISATTNTYTPYLIVGQNDLNLDNDPLITGTDYQELITNFPFGSQILTGVFLEFDITDPSGNTVTSTHPVLDRIGYAARKGLATANVTVPAGGQPIITALDTTTVSIESSITDASVLSMLAQRDAFLQSQQSQLNSQSQDPAVQQRLNHVLTLRFASLTQLMAASFATVSYGLSAQQAAYSLVKQYFSSPRITIASNTTVQSGSNFAFRFAMDLRKDDIRATVFPGQDMRALVQFNLSRGALESATERQAIQGVAISGGASATTSTSVVDVFQAATKQGIGVLSLSSANAAELATLNYSADAKAHITDALSAGKFVVAPTQSVSLNGAQKVAWLELDPGTGVMIDSSEDGQHQSLAEFACVQGLCRVAAALNVLIGAGTLFLAYKFRKDPVLVALIIATGGALMLGVVFAFAALAELAVAELVGTPASWGAVELFNVQAGAAASAPGVAISGVIRTGLGGGLAGGIGGLLGGGATNAGSNGTDPPVSSILDSSSLPRVIGGANSASQNLAKAATVTAGAVQAQVQAASFRASGQLAASWSSTSISSFEASMLTASNATVKNSNGQTIGTGPVGLTLTTPAAAAVSGSTNFAVNGTGDLSFYGPATNALGVSGNWTTYTATLTGSPTVTISTNALTLNGSTLPQGTYTVIASSITLGGQGQTTSPDFASSASLSLTSSAVYLGPGSGTFTNAGVPVSPADGVTLDGFTGTASITGNGTIDSVNLSGTAADVLAVAGSPAPLTTNQNTPVTFATNLTNSLADTYTLTAEAPPGWTITMDTSGNVTATPPPGLQSGTYPVFITAVSQTDANLAAQAAVNITFTGTQPGVTLNVAPNGLFTVPVGNAQLPSAFQATIQNLGPAADTFNLTFPTLPPGFTILDSGTSFTIPPGGRATVGLYVSPIGALPPPGTVAPFSVSVTSTTNPAIQASANASFTVPSVQALSLTASPASFSGIPGSSFSSTLTIQSVGNVPVTAGLTESGPTGVTLGGLTSSVTLSPGQSVTEPLTLTTGANFQVPASITSAITATFGSQSSPQVAGASIAIQLNAPQAVAANQGAQNAATLGRNDIATTLSGLSAAINTVLSSCSSTTQDQVLAYVDNLIAEMNAPFLQDSFAPLQSARAAIASSTCANITTALNQLSTVLSNLATVLTSPAAFPFDFELVPNTAVAQPNQAAQFQILLRNDSTTSNTYTLSLGALPGGVTGNLNQTSITLAAGQSSPLPGGLAVTLTPSTGTAFEFSVTASINGLANSARTITGALTARNTFLQVEDVKATPGFTNAGGSVDVVTHIANVVNQNKTVQVVLTVKNSSNTTVLGPFTQNNVALSVQTLLTTVDFGQINTTGLANGDYSLNVTVIDPATSQPMPGGTGTGTLLIGSPVSATLTASPQTLAPGNGVVTSTLTVSSTGSGNGNMPFSLIGSAATASPAESVAINGTTVYTCDNNEVSVFNASNPSSPLLVNTAFANAIMNAANIFCDIQRGDLVMLADAAGTLVGNNPSFLAFDLTNPTSPSLIASTSVEKRFFGPPYYQGNTAFFKTQSITFGSGFPGPITDQAGDFVSLDVTNFSAPAVLGTVEQQTHGPIFGGSFNVYGITPFSAQLAYAASTTLQGADTQNGVGQLWVVNTTNPSAMSIVTQVNVPGTVQLLVPLVQGSTAVAIGDNGGWISSCCAAGQQSLTGNVVVAVFDLANPQNPQLAANVTTTFLPGPGSGAAVIGPHLFLYSGVMDASNNNFLMLVDTTDPNNPVITTYPIATPINVMKAVGSLLYAPTNSGLQIYSIPGLGAIQYTAAIQIAKNGTVAYNANSFSVPPTSTTPGAGFDTVTWVNPSSNTITWTSNVTGIQPGQVLPVDLGGTVSFTVPAGSGTITLPQADVNSDQIIGLSPATQTVAPGQLAAYMLTLKNPTASSITYNLAVTGVTQNWVTLPSFVAVAAGAQATIALNLRSEIAAIAGTYGFIVTATSGGVSGSVSGTLILQGTGTIGTPSTANALGVVTTLMPPIASGGPGTTTNFTVQLTNAGNVADTYNLSISVPAGVAANFDQTSVQVPPGLSNFRQILLHLTPAQGTPPGPINFTVTATSQTSAAVQGQATGTLTVTAFGVKVALVPQTTNPSTTLQMTITNTGRGSDTFDLALGGPAATVSTLAVNSVTLAAGQSQNVAVTVGAVNFASLGNLTLTATATSRGNTAVLASSSAQITIGPSKGISAAFSPASQKYTAPGPAVFLLQIQNTGTLEDGYTAAITGTTGPVQASLLDLYGNPAQTVSGFRLPGVSSGELVLNAVLGTLSDATVTVTITSTSDSTVKATATASLSAGSGGYPWWWWFFYAP